MRAVTDNVAFSAQHSVLECYSIQRLTGREQVTSIRLVHDKPLGRGSSYRAFCRRLPGCENGTCGSFCVYSPLRELQAGRSLINHLSLFLCVWMIGWAFGELSASYTLLYAVGGREVIVANPVTVTRRTKLFGLSWSKTYLVREMRDLRFQPEVGSGKSRRASRIAFDYGAKTISFALDIERQRLRN